MIKKTTIQAPKRDIASIIDTVKPESKGPSKVVKAKTTVADARVSPKPQMVAKKDAKPMPPKILPKISPVKTVPKIAEQKPLETKVNTMAKPIVKPAPVVQKKIVQKEKPVKPKSDKPEKKTIQEDNILDVPLEHEAYFVYLKNPLEYRRYLLECSRKILYCLRSHQRLLIIRQKKLEGMDRLKTCVKELLYINKKFNEKLPKYNMTFFENNPKEEKAKLQPAIEQKIMAARKPEPKREKTELERLEESLANIESKLRNLQ